MCRSGAHWKPEHRYIHVPDILATSSACNQCLLSVYRGASFREEFAHLSEARSIVSKDVNCIALTATASLGTLKVILRSLCMDFRQPR